MGSDSTKGVVTIRVTKLEAAKRQLTRAIGLYFEDIDPISCHTLAVASHELARGVGRPLGVESLALGGSLESMPEPYKTDYRRLVRSAGNFFKHADRDREKALEFAPGQTEFILLDAEQMITRLTGSRGLAMRLFISWFMCRHPKYLEHVDCSPEQRASYVSLVNIARATLNVDDKSQIWELLQEHGLYAD